MLIFGQDFEAKVWLSFWGCPTGHQTSRQGLAQNDQKCNFWAKLCGLVRHGTKFGRFCAKNPFSSLSARRLDNVRSIKYTYCSLSEVKQVDIFVFYWGSHLKKVSTAQAILLHFRTEQCPPKVVQGVWDDSQWLSMSPLFVWPFVWNESCHCWELQCIQWYMCKALWC